MLWRKEYFRNTWELDISKELKFALTKGVFKNKTAYIFAAGPSLSLVDIENLQLELKDSFVICIKQSVNLLPRYCDLLLMNFCNFSDYNWNDMTQPVVWTSFDYAHPVTIKEKGAKCQSIFNVVDNAKNDYDGLITSTAGKRCWDNFSKITSGNAIWGPGLMYELAIPIALHTGVSKICLVGWDIGSKKEEALGGHLNEHFYKKNIIQMQTKITNLEIDIVADSTRSLKKWLYNQGVELTVISDRSLVDDTICRENQWLKN